MQVLWAAGPGDVHSERVESDLHRTRESRAGIRIEPKVESRRIHVWLERHGGPHAPRGGTPGEFGKLVNEDFVRWSKVVDRIGFKPD